MCEAACWSVSYALSRQSQVNSEKKKKSKTPARRPKSYPASDTNFRFRDYDQTVSNAAFSFSIPGSESKCY